MPALWIKKGYIDTDGFKFYDYFSAVGIDAYAPFEDIDVILENEDYRTSIISEMKKQMRLQKSLDNIQRLLLKQSPFSLKDKYRTLVES